VLSLGLPAAAWLALAALPILLFYFLMLRFRRRPVGSLFLWRPLVAPNEGGAALRLRSILLLFLQLLALALAISAALAPALLSRAAARPGTVFLLDTSASMGATDSLAVGKGFPDRLALAASLIKVEVEKLPSEEPIALFALSYAAVPLAETGTKRGPLLALLDRLASRGGAALGGLDGGFDEDAVSDALAAWLAAREEAWQACIATDGGLDLGGARLASVFGGRLRAISVGLSDDSLGVTGLRLEKTADGGSPARFQVWNGGAAASSRFVLSWEGMRLGTLEVACPPGWSGQALSWAGTATAGIYDLAIEGGKGLGSTYSLAVNAERPLSVLLVGKAPPFLSAALAFAGLRYTEASSLPSDFSAEAWDLLVTVGTRPPAGLAVNLLAFGTLPDDAPLSMAGSAVGTLVAADRAHPLSRFVDWEGALSQGGTTFRTGPEVQVLATIEGRPALVAWEGGGRRSVACGVDLARSDLGLRSAFPIFMQNVLEWCVPRTDAQSSFTLTVGETLRRSEPPSWKLVGGSFVEARRAGPFVLLTATRRGGAVWESSDRRGFVAANPPASELELAPRPLAGLKNGSGDPAGTGGLIARTVSKRLPLATWPLLLLAACLALEWRLWRGSSRRRGGAAEKKRGPISGTSNLPNRASDRLLRLLGALRAASLVAVLLALADFAPPLPGFQRSLALAFDVSDSMGREAVEEERQAALRLVGSLKGGDRVSIATFAARPSVLSGPVDPDTALGILSTASLAAADGASTDLGAGISTAVALSESAGGRRGLILLGDGRANAGSPEPGARALLEGVPIYALPLGPTGGDLVSKPLALPALVHPGERIAARWSIVSDRLRDIEWTLKVGGRVAARGRASLKAGANDLPLELDAGPPGSRVVEVEARDAEGRPLPEAATGGLLVTGGAAGILLVRGDDPGTRDSPLARVLETQGFRVETGGVESLPEQPAGYLGRQALILDDLSALDMTEGQQAALVDFVTGGGGLLVVGGPSSLGRGEYYATPLEELLPLRTDTRRRLFFTRSKLLFVIDQSGSMSEKVGDRSKQTAAAEAVAAALPELNPLDEVGIIGFDSTPAWLLPFTPAGEKTRVLSALRGLDEGGGTDLSAAVEEIARAFGDPEPIKREAIILSDGLTPEADFPGLARRLSEAGVTVSTIAVGEEVNETLLRSLASGTGGDYHRARLDEIPRIVNREAVRMTRELIQEGRIEARSATSGAAAVDRIVAGLGGLPPLSGYLLTEAKPLANIHLEARNPSSPTAAAAAEVAAAAWDPLLASWRYGNGRVAVFTSDSGARWLSAWSGTAAYNRLFGQVVRSTERADPDSGLRADLLVEGNRARVLVEAIGADGRSVSGLHLSGRGLGGSALPFALRETAPGRYEGSALLSGPGLQGFEVLDPRSSSWTSAWTWNPPGGELSLRGPDLSALGLLAADSGGALLSPADPRLPPAGLGWSPLHLRTALIILAVLLLVIELGTRSSMLGRLGEARRSLGAWWSRQKAESETLRSLGWTPRGEVETPAQREEREYRARFRLATHVAERAKEEGEEP